MVKQTKPFILEIKSSRRTKAPPIEQKRSIWGAFASELKQDLAEGEVSSVDKAPSEHCPEPMDVGLPAAIEHEEMQDLPPASGFIEKWAAKRAEKPKAGAADIVAAFLSRIERQRELLAEFEADPAGFTNWRSAWFRKVAGGFGVSIGHDRIDAGNGLRYIVVDSLRDVHEFLDDLGQHVQTDDKFQRALKENRKLRSDRRTGASAL